MSHVHPILRVMSFNIRYGLAEDGLNRWENRKELVLGRIREYWPDLLGLQECRDDAQADYLRENLADYHFHGVRRGGGDQTDLEMAPILFRRDVFQLLDAGCFWLSRTPQQPGSKGWDAVFARTATWCRLLHRETGQSLVFLNTHFDYQSAAIRGAARLLRRWAEETSRQLPVVICGDFNAEKHSAAYRQLTAGSLLLDAHRQAHPGQEDQPTFHAYGQEDQLMVIDWLLVSNHFKVQAAGVDMVHEGARYPSDHYPIWAGIEWQEIRPENSAAN